MSQDRTEFRPIIYSRPWHMDHDDRRHRGKRRWEPAVIDAFMSLVASLEASYPPDWSDRDVVRFRAPGRAAPFAEIDTGDGRHLTIRILTSGTLPREIDGAEVTVRPGATEICLTSPEPLRAPAFAALIKGALVG